MSLRLIPLTDPLQIEAIWPHLQEPEVTRLLPDEFPKTLAELTLWLAAPTVRANVLDVDGVPAGLFVFTGIVPDESAACHVLLWDHERLDPAEVIDNAKIACAAAMTAFRLALLLGMTPTDNLAARLFLTRVGFKVVGTIPEAVRMHGGFRSDAWLSCMTRSMCQATLDAGATKSAKLEVTPTPPGEPAATA